MLHALRSCHFQVTAEPLQASLGRSGRAMGLYTRYAPPSIIDVAMKDKEGARWLLLKRMLRGPMKGRVGCFAPA